MQLIPTFTTDSANYEVLTDGVMLAANVEGATCEIGLREGGGSKYIMDALVHSKQNLVKPHIAIDPYGNIEYYRDEIYKVGRCDYTNEMRNNCLINMYLYCIQNKVDFYFFNMEDTEFFKRYADGIPVYNEHKAIINKYSFVHFDGPHIIDVLNDELEFFDARAPIGAVFVFDDIGMYEHEVVHEAILDRGWVAYSQTPRKIGYVRKVACDKPWVKLIKPEAKSPGNFVYKP